MIENPCPAGLYYKVQNCCTEETKIIYDTVGLFTGITYSWVTSLDPSYPDCWKVIDFTLTGTATMTILGPLQQHKTCLDCIKYIGEQYGVECHEYYTAVSCCGLPNEVVYIPTFIHDNGYSFVDTSSNCYSTLAPTVGPATITWNGEDFTNCDGCITDYPCTARVPLKK
jgi:hypothetical protein